MAIKNLSARLVDIGGVCDPVIGGVGQAIDGQTIIAGDDVLLPNPPNGSSYAGEWIASAGAWARSAEWNTVAAMEIGDNWTIREGAFYKGDVWAFEDPAVPATIDVTPLTIGRRSRRRTVEAGAGITIDGTTPPQISWTAPTDVASTFVEGLKVEQLTTSSIRIKAGATYIPLSGVANMDYDLDLTGLTLTANTWYYLYGYDAGGTVLSIDAPSTQAPNTTAYRGTARSKGPDAGPDLSRRFLRSIRAGASANTMRTMWDAGDWIYWQEPENAAPYTVLVNGLQGATYSAAISCAAVVPPTARIALLKMWDSGSSATYISNDGVTDQSHLPSGADVIRPVVLSAAQAFYYRHPSGVPGNGLNVNVLGYLEPRA